MERAGATLPRFVSQPHADWKPGDPQPLPCEEGEKQNYLDLDPAALGGAACYPLMISSIVPRPIALISSASAQGAVNLAPFSYFGAMSHDPPMVSIGVCRSGLRGGDHKDTSANVLATREFVVNIISTWFAEAANHTCGAYDAGVDEFQVAGLTQLPSVAVKPPRCGEAAVQMECVLRHHYPVKNAAGADTATILLGEVVRFHIHRSVLTSTPSGKYAVDPVRLAPVSRLGGNTYGLTQELFDLPRPDREAQKRVL